MKAAAPPGNEQAVRKEFRPSEWVASLALIALLSQLDEAPDPFEFHTRRRAAFVVFEHSSDFPGFLPFVFLCTLKESRHFL
jgi:hypothetical protein